MMRYLKLFLLAGIVLLGAGSAHAQVVGFGGRGFGRAGFGFRGGAGLVDGVSVVADSAGIASAEAAAEVIVTEEDFTAVGVSMVEGDFTAEEDSTVAGTGKALVSSSGPRLFCGNE